MIMIDGLSPKEKMDNLALILKNCEEITKKYSESINTRLTTGNSGELSNVISIEKAKLRFESKSQLKRIQELKGKYGIKF
ncbi:MAG: hypothetical protein PHZ26_00800 [Candidatus Gracilibacteria bacterium]|nr:hypothetical protein [Candidatus Gracilibacteria bacterium]MDD2908275.1 hypothetical protein [Candidatus Gracilibacteria bacterium]